MECNFFIGQKVTMIEEARGKEWIQKWSIKIDTPEFGKIYTVREIGLDRVDETTIGIRLVEIKNKCPPELGYEPQFDYKCFEPVTEHRVSELRKLLEPSG